MFLNLLRVSFSLSLFRSVSLNHFRIKFKFNSNCLNLQAIPDDVMATKTEQLLIVVSILEGEKQHNIHNIHNTTNTLHTHFTHRDPSSHVDRKDQQFIYSVNNRDDNFLGGLKTCKQTDPDPHRVREKQECVCVCVWGGGGGGGGGWGVWGV